MACTAFVFACLTFPLCLPPLSAVVPPGYYLKAPGQVAACPQGEYKSGTLAAGNCNKCAVGVTTAGVAATAASSCNSK